MKLTILFICSLVAWAAEPKPLPAGEREAVHMAQKALMSTQLDLLSYRERAQVDTITLRQLEAKAAAAGEGWGKMLADLQQAHAAKGCALLLDLSWQCEATK